jgi:DNA-binding response OmpR family regulator
MELKQHLKRWSIMKQKIAFIAQHINRFDKFKSYLKTAYPPYEALFYTYDHVLSAQQQLFENIHIIIAELHPDESINRLLIRQNFHQTNAFKVCISNRVDHYHQILYLRLGYDTCVELSDDSMHIDELIRAQLRFISRVHFQPKEANIKKAGPFTFNFNQLTCLRNDGTLIRLTRKEFKLIHVLLIHPNHVLNYERLIESVWDDKDYGSINALNLLIRRIRQKLTCKDMSQSIITNVHGIGYKLNQEYCD